MTYNIQKNVSIWPYWWFINQGLKNTRFLLISTYHPLHTGTFPTHPPLAIAFDLFVSLLTMSMPSRSLRVRGGYWTHILWRLVSGHRVLCWISLKHRRSSRLSKVEVHFLGLGFFLWKTVLRAGSHKKKSPAELFKHHQYREVCGDFFNIFIYFCRIWCTWYPHTHLPRNPERKKLNGQSQKEE